MEKFSSLDHVVGNITEEEKNEIFEKRKKMFETTDIEGLKKIEREKTPEEKEVLLEINEATNKLRQKYGLEDFTIPEGNMHIIRKNEWASQGETAVALPDLECVLIHEPERKIHFSKTAFHEMVHMKSYNAVQKLTDCNEITAYRSGLMIFPRSQEKMKSAPGGGNLDYFRDMNEAVTEELARRYVMSQIDNPLYRDDFSETRQLREIARQNEMKAFLDEEVFSLYNVPGTDEIHAEKFGYKNFRTALYQIRKTIAEKYPEKFKSSEEVLDVFARAMFTGHMFELSNLMEETFGKGTMRAIGTP